MTAFDHIRALQHIWDSVHPSVAATTANALDDIVNSIFGDPARIGYELMQNADDAATGAGLNIDLKFFLLEKHLVVSHNGAHFSKANVEALCRYGAFDPDPAVLKEEKQHDLKKIGYKGIGFKSVFNISDRVWVLSGSYIFRFDRSFWKDKPMPWQIVPIASSREDLPPSLALVLDKEEVHFILEIKEQVNRDQVKNKLKGLFESDNILLFLRHIRSIELFSERKGGNISSFRRIIRTANTPVYTLERFDLGQLKEKTKWHVTAFEIPVSRELSDSLNHLDKRQCPEKLKVATTVEISFAAKLREDETVVPLAQALLFSYLPTEKRHEFPFLVNGNFLMNEARTQLLDERWNEFLFEQIGYRQFQWFREMASDERFRKEFAGLLVKYTDNNPEKRNRSLNAGVRRAQEEIAFVPVMESDELKRAQETIVDRTGVSEDLGEVQWVKDYFEGRSYEIADPGIKKIEKLLSVGAERFDPQKLRDAIRQGRRFANVKENGRLIRFFYQKIHSVADFSEQEEWMTVLHQTPFLLDQSHSLKEPGEVYLPTHLPELPFSIPLDFLHEKVYKEFVQSESGLLQWLNRLGVAYPQPVELIRRGIFPLISNGGIHSGNSKAIVRYIFDHRDGLEPSDFEILSHLPLLTTRGQLREARFCYLADVYQPKLPLEHLLDEDIFTATDYPEGEQDDFSVAWWNSYFSKMGVKQEMELLLEERFITQYELKNEFAGYFSYLEPFLPPYNRKNAFSIQNLLVPTYLEYAEKNYEFARAYWQILVFEKWKELSVKSGKTRFVQANLKHSIPSWFQFQVQTRACFPAKDGKCYPTPSIYAANLENLFAGNRPVTSILLSPDQENLLGIQSALSLDDCLLLLQEQASHPGELDKERITRIYKYMISRRFQPEEIAGSRLFDPGFLLLSMNNTFQPAGQLLHFDLPRFAEKSDAAGFVFLDLDLAGTEKWCRLFHIHSLKLEDLQLVLEPAELNESVTLEEVWKEKLKTISLIASSRLGRSFRDEIERLKTLTEKTTFIPAATLKLVFMTEEKELYRKEVHAWLQEETIYYKEPWENPRNLFDLQEILSRYFGLPGIEREMALLLSLDWLQLQDWLSEQGYDWEPVLGKGRNEVAKRADQPLRRDPSSDKVIKVESGQFKSPVRIITPAPTPRIEPPFAGRLGRWAEEHVRKTGLIENYYQEAGVEIQYVEWMNAVEESKAPFDFRALLADGRVQYWEIKATPSTQKVQFPISGAEFRHALQHSQDYFLVRILAAGSKEAEARILQDPAQLIVEGRIQVLGLNLEIQ